jgi:hypothetical protein
MVTTSTDTTARVWDVVSGALLSDLVGHNNRVTGVTFSRDGSAFVTWSADGTARVWDTGRGAARVILAGHGDPVASASFDASGDTVLTTTVTGTARLWASRVDSELEPVASIPTPISAAEFSDEGNAAAVAGGRGIENLETGQVALLAARSVAARHRSRWLGWPQPRKAASRSGGYQATAADTGRLCPQAHRTRQWRPGSQSGRSTGGPDLESRAEKLTLAAGTRSTTVAFSPTVAPAAAPQTACPKHAPFRRPKLYRTSEQPLPALSESASDGDRLLIAG